MDKHLFLSEEEKKAFLSWPLSEVLSRITAVMEMAHSLDSKITFENDDFIFVLTGNKKVKKDDTKNLKK